MEGKFPHDNDMTIFVIKTLNTHTYKHLYVTVYNLWKYSHSTGIKFKLILTLLAIQEHTQRHTHTLQYRWQLFSWADLAVTESSSLRSGTDSWSENPSKTHLVLSPKTDVRTQAIGTHKHTHTSPFHTAHSRRVHHAKTPPGCSV